MRLGIDFGTTRIVVAAVDRGNYPVLAFDGPEGQSYDWFPPLVAVAGSRVLYGWEAWSAQTQPGATIIRSLKSTLESAGPGTLVELGGQQSTMIELLAGMACSLKQALIDSVGVKPGEALEVMLGVPANANSNQRFLTVEAFRQAGFDVLGLLNEPSAASIEFGHKNAGKQLDRVLVYDLGGGTFDVSLVEMNDRTHSVLASEGIPTLGGDDFDEALSELALDALGLTREERDSLTQAESFRLLEECRARKESLNPNTRKIVMDLEPVREGWGTVTVLASDYFERCRPLVEETLHATGDLLAAHGLTGEGAPRIEALYVTGGGSELPLVARMLREQFGRRVRRSAHTRTATAIGLAIQADEQAGYVLREKFTRYFGVWREGDAGRTMVFDPLFEKGSVLPGPGEPLLQNLRTYEPVHNIGHFRYLECSHRAADGRPTGDIAVWDEILFPFDSALEAKEDLTGLPVEHCGAAADQVIEEAYSCDSSGTVEVKISNLTAGHSREYRLGKWAAKAGPVVPGRKRRGGSKRANAGM